MNPVLNQACRIARAVTAGSARVYLLHVPLSGRAWVGWGPGRVITLQGGALTVEEDGQRRATAAGPHPFRQLAAEIVADRPAFFMTSLDLARGRVDPELPLLYVYQPSAEVALTGGAAPHFVGGLPRERELVAEVLADCVEAPPPRPQQGLARDFQSWENEGDARFLERLRQAVATLRGRDGKMILMRPYSRLGERPFDLLRLFEIYAGFEDQCAASHYARLRPGLESVGCSPENVFELEGDRLTFDVVAGTRGVADDAEKDRRWALELENDPKEIHEHEMALARYRARLEGVCRPGTVTQEQHRGVRRLFHVRHLHSRLSGRLQQRTRWLELAEESHPPLESYPKELIPLADPSPEPTRFYGGMVGRAEAGGDGACCYLNLRALLAKGDRLFTQGGVGVIGGSIPEQELLEVHNKLRALAEAVDLWDRERAGR